MSCIGLTVTIIIRTLKLVGNTLMVKVLQNLIQVLQHTTMKEG